MNTIRDWIGEQIRSHMVEDEAKIISDSDIIRQDFENAERVKHSRSFVNNPIERERLSFNFRVTRVDLNEKGGLFRNPWHALHEQKHGRMVRVGVYEHVDYERQTPWTRHRASQQQEGSNPITEPSNVVLPQSPSQ